MLERSRLCELAVAAGFVALAPDTDDLVHVVDRSITRDVLALTRPI